MQPGAALNYSAVLRDEIDIELSSDHGSPTPSLAQPVLRFADVHTLGRCFVKRRLVDSRLLWPEMEDSR